MPLKYPTTSKTLLDKIASGDEISWNDFYEKYSPVVKALTKFKCLDAAAGAVAGNTIGKLIDDNVLRIWKCGTCGHTWRAA